MASSALASGLKLVPPALIGFAAYVVAYAPMHPAKLDAQASSTPMSQVMLVSQPDGATLLRDGKELGKAPLLLQLATGSEPATLVARFADGVEITQAVDPKDATVAGVFVREPAPAAPGATNDPEKAATRTTKKGDPVGAAPKGTDGSTTAQGSTKVAAPVGKKADRKPVSRSKKKRGGGKEGTIDPFQ